MKKQPLFIKILFASLLHLEPTDIQSVEILNPIILGESMDAKSFILDINVLLNNNTIINLEMQINNLGNWTDRSLDYEPFPGHPEFYATYRLLNTQNHHLYSDKFTLSVADLTHIELAAEEDAAYSIDKWAALFKASSLEEIAMSAKNNEYLAESTETLYTLNADEMIRRQCQAREDAELKNKDAELAELRTRIKELQAMLESTL